ncbi:FAD-dependent monooxygenase [Streptomyces sp. HNM0663]|uniref:FAD-dependent monooxygenase n=1 Tax=Streptomyces chengmaiensis TaxID=3040919 RepID=A0ABT6HSZ4_9ACTN|nr:FAD-dependent monooxygenase [Streptomyces chengmaiensis]MDH2391179.1 FAD-dependent monooxygenase [Streptomyces chengmaiensis]
MAPTVIAGGGTAGLALALALGTRGHRVRLLERGEAPPDGPAVKSAEVWQRPTVPQAPHDHILNALGVRTLRRHAPRVLDAALGEGARLLDLRTAAPGEVADEDLLTLVCRRSVLDLVLHRAVRALPGVTITHDTTVTGLLLHGQRVTGVAADTGETIPTDLVVDASGRRSASRSWLAAAGLKAPRDLTGPTRLRAFGRFYRLRDPDAPPPGPLNRGNAAGGIWGHYSAVVHPADNDLFAITLGTLPGDHATTALGDPAAFTAACRISPYLAAWVDEAAAAPLGPVRVIGMPPNILRGTPSVTGLLQVGDAACVTDPMFGRGLSLALTHAFRLAELIDRQPYGSDELSRAAADLADELLRPWYEQAAHDSWARIERWRAETDMPPTSQRPPAPPPVPPHLWAAALTAAATDPVVWRGIARARTGLGTPAEIFADDGFLTRVEAAPATPLVGARPPTRSELRQALVRKGA